MKAVLRAQGLLFLCIVLDMPQALIPAVFSFLNSVLRVIYQISRFTSDIFSKIIQKEAKIGENLLLSPKGKIILGVEYIGNKGWPFGKPVLGDHIWGWPNSLIHGKITTGKGVTILEGSC